MTPNYGSPQLCHNLTFIPGLFPTIQGAYGLTLVILVFYQVVIPAESWFAQRMEKASMGDFCLTGVTVAPGWDLTDMDFLSTDDLVKLFPQHEEILREFDVKN